MAMEFVRGGEARVSWLEKTSLCGRRCWTGKALTPPVRSVVQKPTADFAISAIGSH